MPKNKIPVKNYGIRVNVLLGFAFAILAVVAAGYFTYKSTQKLVGSVLELSEPNTKLSKLRDVFSDLTEAESNLRIYALIKDDEYFNNYLGFITKVTLNIDSLKDLTIENEEQNRKIKLISTLLKNRLKNVDDFVGFKQKTDTVSYTLRALKELKTTPYDSVRTQIYTRTSTTVSTIDTLKTIVEPEPRIEQSRGFFTRVAEFFTGKEKQVAEAAEKVNKVLQETNVVRDTSILIQADTMLLERVRAVLADLKEEESRVQKQLFEKELELLRNNSLIISKIMDIIAELELAELNMLDSKTDEAREVASHSVMVISGVLLSSLFVILLFTFLIMRNVSRSNFYRDQLYLAKQRAEELARVKEEFLANMSHEIRTPLNSIIGFSEQLSRTMLSEDQVEQLKAVQVSSEHLLALVNDILDFSKIEQGKLKLESIPFRLKDVVQETYNTFRNTTIEKKIGFTFDIESLTDLVVMGDPLRLKQVLFNLVGNAVKFTEKGEVKLSCIRLDNPSQTEDHVWLRFEVMDTGIGITPEKLQTIFDGFTQADSSLTRKYGGTGLGLTISKRLVEMQDGTIKVKSQTGKGSVFSFEVPYQLVDQETISIQEVADVSFTPLFIGKRLLLVDDDNLNVRLTSMILERWGIVTDTVNNGTDAIQHVVENEYDLILTDIHMPDMSGVEMTQKIRALDNPDKASLPIVAITANIMKDDLEQYLKSGIDDYLLKPYREKELYAKLNDIFGFEAFSSGEDRSIILREKTNTGIDFYELERFAAGNRTALCAILRSFVDDNEINITMMKNGLDIKDYDTIASLAHKMLTPFGYLKAHDVIVNLQKLEQIHLLPNHEDISALVSQVADDAYRLFPEIERHVLELQASTV